jgi:hypothetical protein
MIGQPETIRDCLALLLLALVCFGIAFDLLDRARR